MNNKSYISIKRENVEAFIVSMLLFHFSFFAISTSYMSSYPDICTMLGFLLVGYCLINIKHILDYKHYLVNLILILWGISMYYSNVSEVSTSIGYIPPIAGLRQSLQYVMPFFVMEVIKQKNWTFKLMKSFWAAAFFYAIVTDVHALLTGAKYGGLIGNYLVGNKFNICYLHYYMLGFFLFIWDEHKFKDRLLIIVMYLLSIFIAIYSECSTVLLGLLVFFVMYLFRSKVFPILQKPTLAIILIVVSNVVLIVFPAVLSIGPIQYIIENILHEDISLTGRMRGYARMLGALIYNPVWGVGYYNKYLISRFFTNMDDLQNGLADVALGFGIVGVVFLVLVIYFSFINGAGKKSIGFVFIVYMFILISSVEITLNLKFVVLLALIMVCEKEKTGDKLIVWN